MKNRHSVFTLAYRKSYYILRPWKLIHETYWNIRNFIHRGRYGFAYVDTWNWNNWWAEVGAEALRYMAKHGNAYPGVKPYDTPEIWRRHLLETAEKLEWCSKSMEETSNEYHKEFMELCNRCTIRETDGTFMTSRMEMTEKDKEIRDKYYKREEELQKENQERRAEILAEIGRNFEMYWD